MSGNKPVWAVVPAAGSGNRMGANRPKQYLGFQGKAVLAHCLDRILSHEQVSGAVIALGEDDAYWADLDYRADKPLLTVVGGVERQHSVLYALRKLQQHCGDDVIALVHDAARPLVVADDIGRVIDAARQHPAGAILAAAVSDTLKRQTDSQEIEQTVNREGLWRALTPQVFHLPPLLAAMEQVVASGQLITDDAQALELQGQRVALVAGRADNIKLTSPDDLPLAEQIWLNQRNQ